MPRTERHPGTGAVFPDRHQNQKMSERAPLPPAALDVLQQFRLIYGTMRQYFREVEERCGLPGSQMWILQEVMRSPGIGISELAARMGVHQSTCSQLVERLQQGKYLEKRRRGDDLRRIGLYLDTAGSKTLQALPGPAAGVLPEALSQLPEAVLETLKINLDQLIGHLPAGNRDYARTPLAEMLDRERDENPSS